MNNPFESRRNRNPSYPRPSLSSRSIASSARRPSEHSDERDSYPSSGEMDDEASSGGMSPSSSPVRPPEHVRNEGLFIEHITSPQPAHPQHPNAASPPGEENLQGFNSRLNCASPALNRSTDVNMTSPGAHSSNSATSHSSPLPPSSIPPATPSCGRTSVRSASARSQEDTSDSIFVQAGQQVVDMLVAIHGFSPRVVLSVFQMSGDVAAADAALGEMAEAAWAVFDRLTPVAEQVETAMTHPVPSEEEEDALRQRHH
ncbi:hypothetical protein B0H19DRAFT_1270760 [Mycena capillaripes]|nr:hypothetical protein B0H19DRAFT_1270760 [Mycena capillaripes]